MVVPGLQFLTFLRPLSVSEVETKTMDGFLPMSSFSSTLVGIEQACKVRAHLFLSRIPHSFHR